MKKQIVMTHHAILEPSKDLAIPHRMQKSVRNMRLNTVSASKYVSPALLMVNLESVVIKSQLKKNVLFLAKILFA